VHDVPGARSVVRALDGRLVVLVVLEAAGEKLVLGQDLPCRGGVCGGFCIVDSSVGLRGIGGHRLV